MVVEVERQTINVSAAAKALGLSRATAYSLANRNELPGCFRCGRRFLVSVRVLERLLEGENSNSPSQPNKS